MTFVLWHPVNRKFVAPEGYDRSYTRSLLVARIFLTREEAEANRCVDSEVVRPISDFKGWELRR